MKSDLDKKLLEMTSSDSLPDIEIVKPKQEDVLNKYFGVVEKTEKPLTDLDVAICTALGQGGISDDDIVTEFDITKKYLALLKRNKEAQKFIKEMINLRLDVAKASLVGTIQAGVNYQTKKIMDLLNSDNESNKNLAMAYLFGKKSLIEAGTELEKMKSPENESGEDIKDFFAGLMEASIRVHDG